MLHTVSASSSPTADTAHNPCICIFSALYEPHIGGVESYTKGIAEALVAKGQRVIVVTMNTNGAAPEESSNSVEVIRLPCRPFLNGRFPLPLNNNEADRLWSWLNEQPIDNVVINTRFYCLSSQGAHFARTHGITPLLIEHGSAHLTLGNPALDAPLHLIEHAMTASIKRYNPTCFAVSKKASTWLSHFGIASQGEISNAIDADAFVNQASNRDFRNELGIPEDALLIAFAGRFVPEKGVLQLAEAIKDLEADCNIFAIMAGDGPLRCKVQQLGAARLATPGTLSKSDLAALLLQADALCLPSRSEGFCTMFLEAAACGTAIIATDVGGMHEIAPTNEYGILLESMSASDVKAALEKAASNRATIKHMGEQLAARVRSQCTWEQSAHKLIQETQAATSDAPKK